MDHEFASSNVLLRTARRFAKAPRPAFPPPDHQLPFQSDPSHSDSSPSVKVNNASSTSQVSNSSHPSDVTPTSSTVPPYLKLMRQSLRSARASSQLSLSNPLASTDPSLSLSHSLSAPDQPDPTHPSPSRVSQLQIGRSNPAPSPKRPPASHSSYGVETIVGPPPSFDTQRTLSQERVYRIDRSKSLRIIASDRLDTSSQPLPQIISVAHPQPTDVKDSAPATPALTQSSPDTLDTYSVPTPTNAEEDPAMELRSDYGLGVSHSEVGSKTSSESHKSEDLFLNIARVDATRPDSSKGEKRRSRVSLPFFSSARPATSYNPDAMHLQTDPALTTPRAGVSAHHVKRGSLQFGHMRGLDQNSEHGSIDASSSGHYGRRSSVIPDDTIRISHRPATGLRTNRLVSEGGYLDRPKLSEHNATESTVSTAAPSTVWDELDDLKSRIRKLELTGKLPPSSAAAMSSAERPRTATTAATTMSSSPKYNKVTNNLQSTIETTPSDAHPLLQEALSNAQAVVSHEVYQKLRATAQDALQLASFPNIDEQSERGGAPFLTDRQLRRRTESLCRNLTELAISLATEPKLIPHVYGRTSKEYNASPGMGLRSRRYSNTNEPTDRQAVNTRVSSRLETRRVSTQTGYPNPRRSTDLESPLGPSQYLGSGSRSTRPSAAYHARRNPGFLDGANDEEQNSPSIRPLSRAMTDVSAARHLPRDHAAVSREYTMQHPMPGSIDSPSSHRTPLPSNVTTNFTSRRKYTSPASLSMADSSPLATRASYGRISIVQQDVPPPSDTASETSGPHRSVSTRRSFGLASRIGTSVNSRLRSARTESRTFKDSPLSAGDETNHS